MSKGGKMQSEAMNNDGSVAGTFFRYISLNIIGMLGMSCYILADTYFISRAAGPDGITVLNLCLPVYNLIFAIGAMIGTGAAIRWSIERSAARKEKCFTNALWWILIIGGIITIAGGLNSALVLRLMGGDEKIVRLGVPYLRTFIIFTPFFMANYAVTSFVRNDGGPGIAMIATISSSLFNILFDYILMFPLQMGLAGAALATAVSPVVSMCVSVVHFRRADNHIRLVRMLPDRRLLADSMKLGVAAFVSEMATGVTTTVFNYLILGITGNLGVAAYGVVANLAIVGTSLFNGAAQGSQPLISRYYASGRKKEMRETFRLGMITAVSIAAVLYVVVSIFADPMAAAFNSEHSEQLQQMARVGLRIYFLGFLFSGMNIFLSNSFSAIDQPLPSAIIALTRGFAASIFFAILLARIFGMNGVWAAYPACEGATLVIGMILFGFTCRRLS